MIALLLLACAGGGGGASGADLSTWGPPWSTHLTYLRVDPAVLDGGTDTALPAEAWFHAGITASEAEILIELREGEIWASAEPAGSLTLIQRDGLYLRAVNGQEVSPPVALATDPVRFGQGVQTGDWSATPEAVDPLSTWYGVFSNGLELRVSGPADGLLRIAPGVGPVQLWWGDLAGDLYSYEPL